MKGIKIILLAFTFGLMLFSIQPVKAQCAACAAQVETNAKNGGKMANGLNKGILVLMAAPYLVVGVVGFLWYKKYRRKDVNLNMHKEKLHLN